MGAGTVVATTVRPSPNIWDHPDTYELENLAFDREQQIEALLETLHPYAAATLLDVGCGTGFHLPRFAARGARVLGVEPHPPLAARAWARVLAKGAGSGGGEAKREPGVGRVAVAVGAAQHLPVADASIDIAHARWAYFFGPGCEPGLAEMRRVIRPGGVAVVIDNDATTSTFGEWFAQSHPGYDALAVERFWRRAGFTRERLLTSWQARDRAEFEALVRIEFEANAADRILAGHAGSAVDYAVNVWWRRY